MKKICSAVLALLLVLSMAPLGVMAASDLPSVGYLPYDYTVRESDQTVVITWFKGETDATAVIPATIADRPVVAIGNGAFTGCTELISVELPDTVTMIDMYAFSGCSKLTSVTMSDNVSFIGESAFMNCDLHQITIPSGLTAIGRNAFAGNANLVNLTIPSTVKEIGDGAFANCTYLSTLRIEEGVQTFGNGVFSGCSYLQNVMLPADLTTVGENLFDGCSALKTINVCAPEKPAGWNDNWLGDCTATVNWGYAPEHSTLGHIGMQRMFGAEPTCTKEGIIPHYLCKTCNRTFEDRAGTIELTDVTIPKSGHVHEGPVDCAQGWTCAVCGEWIGASEHLAGDWTVTKQATCSATGTRVKTCTICGVTVATETISKKSHTPGAAADCTKDQTCTVCGVVIKASTGHTAGDWKVTKEATCTEAGTRVKTCTVCGVTVSTEAISAKGHTPGAAADCTKDQTCTVCNAVIKAATGHTAGAWNITKQATCTEAGEQTKSCTKCGTVMQTEAIPAKGHTPGAAADCTKDQTCTVCNAVIKAATGHIAGDWKVTKEATCTEAGEQTKSCTKCGTVMETEAIPAKGHTFVDAADGTGNQVCTECGAILESGSGHIHTAGDWTTTKQATCTEAGEKVKTCTICEAVLETEVIPAKGHTPGEAANCMHALTCTVCGLELEPATDHTVSDWTVTKEATCTEAGEKTKSCTVCGTVLATATIPAKGHTPGDAADCTHAWTCIECGLELEPALGHTLGAWKITKEATCTEAGEIVRACTVCGVTVDTIALPAKGHIAGDWTITKQATCTEAGERVKHCTGCDTVVEFETIPVAAHTVGDWVTNLPATCTETGFKTKSCTACGAVTEVQILDAKGHTPGAEATCTQAQTCTVCGEILNPAKGHTESDWTVTKQPTCTETGVQIKTCTVCGETLQTESIPANGHTAGEWTVTKQPTCTETGEQIKTCTVCGVTVETGTVSAKGHTPGAEATCTQAQTCTDCGVILNPAKGHTESDWTVTEQATCTGTGEKIKTCTDCGKTVATEVIPAKGHTPGAEATCTKAQTCADCGVILNPAKGHTIGDWTVAKEATCTEFGEKTKACADCGAVAESEIIFPKGHTPGAEATCTKAQTCTVCGAILNPAKGHTESDWTVTKEPTCMQTGEQIKTCTECGVVLKVEVIPVLPEYQTYTVGDQVVISEYLGAESNVTVPTEIDGHNVSAIGASAYQNCDFLEEVTLPETVKTIESKAFANCTSLTSVTIPASVETIGKGAFEGCDNLTDIYFETASLPEGVDEQWLEGCHATVHFLSETTPKATLKGDLNGDGELTAADFFKARRAFFELSPLSEEELALIDFDGNGRVDAGECMKLKRAINGLGEL